MQKSMSKFRVVRIYDFDTEDSVSKGITFTPFSTLDGYLYIGCQGFVNRKSFFNKHGDWTRMSCLRETEMYYSFK